MTPRRRQVLTAVGTTGVAALAGCRSLGGKHTTKLAPADGDNDDFFGSSVAVAADGTTALVGAKFDEGPNGNRAGAVHVFERPGNSWRQ